MLISTIGNISLNISFVLYLIVYVPQIIHNQTSKNIAQLSLGLHFLLYISYSLDLCYGFSNHLPWQYKTVSVIGLLLVLVQQLQLIQFFVRQRFFFLVNASGLFLLLNCLTTTYFFIVKHGVVDYQTTFMIGSIARLCGLMYCVPQLIKNKMSKSANAISLHFIYLNLFVALLDTISSWCLDWGWPNKLSAPVNIVLMIMMLAQIKKYAYSFNVLKECKHDF